MAMLFTTICSVCCDEDELKSQKFYIQISCPGLLQVDWLTFETFPNNSAQQKRRHMNKRNAGVEITCKIFDRLNGSTNWTRGATLGI